MTVASQSDRNPKIATENPLPKCRNMYAIVGIVTLDKSAFCWVDVCSTICDKGGPQRYPQACSVFEGQRIGSDSGGMTKNSVNKTEARIGNTLGQGFPWPA